MGYSYWGESFLRHMQELVVQMQSDLSLAGNQMSFMSTHDSADIDHAADVRRMMARFADTDRARTDVLNVAQTSLFLMRTVLDAIVVEHRQEVSRIADESVPDTAERD